VAGILVESRPQEHWAVVGIGVNVAVSTSDLPTEIRARAGTLGLSPAEIEPWLERLVDALAHWLRLGEEDVLTAVRARDALLGQPLRWAGGCGTGAGIDGDGRLVVETSAGRTSLDAGEVHLGTIVEERR
jgi:biotin-(acetyl-CoA carboxylase) ligase